MSKIGIVLDNHTTICIEVKDFQTFYTELTLARNPQMGSGYLPVRDLDGIKLYINTDKIVMIEAEKDE